MTALTDRFSDWGSRAQLMTLADNADQVERDAICFGTAPVAAGLEDERAGGVYNDEAIELAPDNKDDWQVVDEVIEIAEGGTIEEIQERSTLLGQNYPFILDGAALRYRPSQTGVYEFCLAASLTTSIKRKPFNRIPVEFERVAADVVRQYMGTGSIALRTGWPSHDRDERPIKLKALARKLHEQTGEWHWSPRPPNPDDPHHRKAKDAGVDFVVWTPMPDLRPGKLFLLGQCACGNDWDTKLDEPNQKELDRWFRPATVAPFVKAFAMPRPITSQGVFAEMGTLSRSVVFDRMRITALAEANPTAFAHWKARLDRLTALVIPAD